MKTNKQKDFSFFFMILFLTVFSGLIPHCYPEDTIPAPSEEKKEVWFKIGFINTDIEDKLNLAWYNNVKKSLEENHEISELLRQNGFSGILVLPSDSYRDMIQRMEHNEFDMAFCSAEIYVEQKGEYEPFLQFRRKRDIWGRGKVFQKGEIWINKNSPLFSQNEIKKDELAKYIGSRSMAFVSSHSAAGYMYPLLKIHRELDGCQPANFIFCNSNEEVVKYIVNDMVGIGVCENGVVDEVFEKYGITDDKDKILRKIMDTELLPTSPVCLLKKWAPETNPLGRALSAALKKVFSGNEQNVPKLESCAPDTYKNLREEIDVFNKMRTEEISR